jgi:hypothetical protein
MSRGGGAEELLVIAAEVRWGFVAHAVPGARRVQVFAEHQAARFLEPYLLPELEGVIAVTDLK